MPTLTPEQLKEFEDYKREQERLGAPVVSEGVIAEVIADDVREAEKTEARREEYRLKNRHYNDKEIPATGKRETTAE